MNYAFANYIKNFHIFRWVLPDRKLDGVAL